MQQSEVLVIGGGPAGMAAAATAARNGAAVALLDEQPRPGGQIYRDVERSGKRRAHVLGADYLHGAKLAGEVKNAPVTYLDSAVAWAIEDRFRVSYTRHGRGAQIEAKSLILATGALERPMPVPGWTLPGVMTAGAAQILLKQSGVLPRRAVLVGCGPLIYLIAAQMVRAGMPPVALVETQTQGDLMGAARYLGGALRGWRYLAKGLSLLSEIRRARVPRHTGATAIAIDGDARAEAVIFESGGRSHRIACDTVLLHHGVVPNTQAARSIGVTHRWDAAQHCFSPQVDDWGATDIDGVLIAGDGAGIGGAGVAELSGRIAALGALEKLGRITAGERDRQAAPFLRERARERAVRPFLDAAYPPLAEAVSPADETIVCRCEEITAGEVRGYARLGCLGPNQAKAFGRPGMGPCQGRYCGLTVTWLLAQANDQSPDETGYYRIRPPLKPVTLGELADMEDTPADASE